MNPLPLEGILTDSHHKLIQAFREIIKILEGLPSSGTLSEATQIWIESEDRDPRLKGIFLLSHFGSPDFQLIQKSIPQNQEHLKSLIYRFTFKELFL